SLRYLKTPENSYLRCRKRYNNSDLPANARKDNLWRRKFITTLTLWSGGYKDPFVIPNDDLWCAIRVIWRAVYHDTAAQTAALGPAVLSVSKQRLSEWRAGFGSAAVAMLSNLFAEEKVADEEDRREFAEALLNDNYFLYEHPEAKTGRGLFRSPFILQVFACHWVAVRDHVDVHS
ncbi:hypothetical protein BJ138DRAFT_968409, partial [Hygrophoropsis aurantiaca]